MQSLKKSSRSETPPKFEKGAEVYYRNFDEYKRKDGSVEIVWRNRVFFKVGYSRWDEEKGVRRYMFWEGCYIEEDRLRRGDVLSLMIQKDEEDE